MMARSQISLPAEDQRRARARANDLGTSLAEYVRRLVRADLGDTPPTADVTAIFDLGASGGSAPPVTTDVLVESWLLTRGRLGRRVADRFSAGLRGGIARIEPIGHADLDVAWEIGATFSDQELSLVDRTCFAAMQRLGIHRAASFDDHFAILRVGPRLDRAFEVVR